MNRPPQWPVRMLEWFCDPELSHEIVGDLDEMYREWLEKFGPRKARRLYVLHTIKFLRPFIFRRKKGKIRIPMTLNYFKTGWRNIVRNKAFVAINVVGLSLGLACTIMVYMLVSYHLSFDRFHPDLDRTYRIVTEWKGETVQHLYPVPQPLGKAFMNDFAFAEKMARTRGYRLVTVSLPEEPDAKKFQEESKVQFAEPTFFEMFNFPVI